MVSVWYAVVVCLCGIFAAWYLGYRKKETEIESEDAVGELVIAKDEEGEYVFFRFYDAPEDIMDSDRVVVKIKHVKNSQ